MQTSATLRFSGLSPQKARLVADQIRGLRVERAINILTFHEKSAAIVVKKLLNSAIANAENNFSADIDVLRVSQIFVNKGPVMRRFRARAKGRANRIEKPTCHITVIVADEGN